MVYEELGAARSELKEREERKHHFERKRVDQVFLYGTCEQHQAANSPSLYR